MDENKVDNTISRLLNNLLKFINVGSVEGVKETCSAINKIVKTNILDCRFNGLTPLVLASQNGLTEIVTALLEAKASVNYPDERGNLPIVMAAFTNQTNTVKELVRMNSNLTSVTASDGSSLLTLFAGNGNVELLQLLVAAKATINYTAEDFEAPLYTAVTQGHVGFVKELLTMRADIYSKAQDGSTILHAAAEEGNIAIVQELLRMDTKNVLLNEPKNDGRTPLFMAAQLGNIELLKHLLTIDGIEIASTKAQVSPVYIAAQRGHNKIIEVLTKQTVQKIDVNQACSQQITPLYLAACHGHLEICKMLVEAKADVNITIPDGRTPVYMAAGQNHLRVVDYLVEQKADVNLAMTDNATPLIVAAQAGHLEIVKALISYKADITCTRINGVSALTAAQQRNKYDVVCYLLQFFPQSADDECIKEMLLSAIEGNSITLLQTLLNQKANVNAKIDGMPLLHLGLADSKVVDLLVEYKADTNLPNAQGTTPLALAILSDKTNVARMLIEQPQTDLNLKTVDEESQFFPLYCASLLGNLAIVDLLITKKADINAQTKEGCSATYAAVAANTENLDVLTLLIQNKCDINLADEDAATPLFRAVQQEHLESVKLLLEANANPNLPHLDGSTPLYLAASKGNVLLCELLLAAGAKADVPTKYGDTPLWAASQTGSAIIVERLISLKANLNANLNGITPLLKACGMNNLPVVDIILSSDSRAVNTSINNGPSALGIASSLGYDQLAKFLLAKGADVNYTDKMGTPLFYAVTNGHLAIAQELLLQGADIHVSKEMETTGLKIPVAVQQQGSTAIRDYLHSIYTIPIPQVKLILLGHGRSGKTSLLQSIAKQSSNNKQNEIFTPSTVGIDICELTKFPCETRVFDLAGQVEYLPVHQYFMSRSNALYVIVVSCSSPNSVKQQQISFWLNYLQSNKYNTTTCNLVIVGTFADQVGDIKEEQQWLSNTITTAMSELCIESTTIHCLVCSSLSGKGIPAIVRKVNDLVYELAKKPAFSAILPSTLQLQTKLKQLQIASSKTIPDTSLLESERKKSQLAKIIVDMQYEGVHLRPNEIIIIEQLMPAFKIAKVLLNNASMIIPCAYFQLLNDHEDFVERLKVHGWSLLQQNAPIITSLAELNAACISTFDLEVNGAQLQYLHDIGVLVLGPQPEYYVCLHPQLLAKVVAAFVCDEDHLATLTADSDVEVVAPVDGMLAHKDVVHRIEHIMKTELKREVASQEVNKFLSSLESYGLCYSVKDKWLFPSLLQIGNLWMLPQLATSSNVASKEHTKYCGVSIKSRSLSRQVFLRLLAHCSDMHLPNFKLYLNGFLIHDSLDNVGLVLFSTEGITNTQSKNSYDHNELIIIARGSIPGAIKRTVTSKLLEVLRAMQLSCKITQAPLCPYHVQSAGNFSALKLVNDIYLCDDTQHTVAMDEAEEGAKESKDFLSRHKLWDAVYGQAFYLAEPEKWSTRDACQYTILSVEDSHPARKAEYEKVQQLFEAFVSKYKDQDFELTEVTYVKPSAELETKFQQCYDQYLSRAISISNDDNSKEEFTEVQNQTLNHFHQYLGRVSGSEQVNLMMAWHANFEKWIWQSCSDGIYVPEQLTSTQLDLLDKNKLRINNKLVPDAGFYGRGFYMTQSVSYADYYIKLKNAPDESCLMLGWVLGGRVFPVVEQPVGKNSFHGRPVKESYDSHYATVVAPSFFPTKLDETPDADEIILFNKSQVLPRYVIKYSRSDFGFKDELNESDSVIVWIDDKPNSKENRYFFKQLKSINNIANNKYVRITSLQKTKNWFALQKAVLLAISRRNGIRVITNNYRKYDGRDKAGEVVIEWIKRHDLWRNIPVLVYCNHTTNAVALARPARSVFVTNEPEQFVQFCDLTNSYKTVTQVSSTSNNDNDANGIRTNHWISATDVDSCEDQFGCNISFSLFHWKYHCRLCGHIFCKKHTSNTLPLNNNAEYDKRSTQFYRVCDGCYFKHTKKT